MTSEDTPVSRVRAHVVLSAGMPRSGSTWVYNALRLLIAQSTPPTRFSSGWIDDWRYVPRNLHNLFKIHTTESYWLDQADLIVYSFRDIRDVLASLQRMFGNVPSLSRADDLMDQDRHWRQVADCVVRYEDFQNSAVVLSRLANLVGVSADMDKLADALKQLRYDPADTGQQYDPVTLLHPGHVTHGGGRSWVGVVEPSVVDAVEAKYGAWLVRHGYPL